MKGTYIKVVNEIFLEELEKRKTDNKGKKKNN